MTTYPLETFRQSTGKTDNAIYEECDPFNNVLSIIVIPFTILC
jgi:hypothetical protein